MKRLNFLCALFNRPGYDYKFALEAKPNEPRGDIYLPTTGATAGLHCDAETIPKWSASIPKSRQLEQMSGLNFYHVVAQAIEAGKLFHIDLNDQKGSAF